MTYDHRVEALPLSERIIIKKLGKRQYVVWSHGPIGAKFNMGPGFTGLSFPWEVTEIHTSFQDAKKAAERFKSYVDDKLRIKRPKNTKPEENHSFYYW